MYGGKKVVPDQHDAFFPLFWLWHADYEAPSSGLRVIRNRYAEGLGRRWELEKHVQLHVQKTAFTFLNYLVTPLRVRGKEENTNNKQTPNPNKKTQHKVACEKFLFANKVLAWKGIVAPSWYYDKIQNLNVGNLCELLYDFLSQSF